MSKVEKLKEAIKSGKSAEITAALQLHENPQTMVSYFYKYRNSIRAEVREKIFEELIKPHMAERKRLSQNRVKKNISLNHTDVKQLIDNKNKSPIDLLIYQLLNTGRRLKELTEFKGELVGNKLVVQLSKEKMNFTPFLLDKNPKGSFEDIQSFQKKFNKNSISAQIARKLKPLGITAHDLRGVYAVLIHKFHNPKKLILHNIANTHLGHKSKSSDRFYTQIQYSGANPFDATLEKLTVKQLRKLAKEKGLRGYSRTRKAALLTMLSSLSNPLN